MRTLGKTSGAYSWGVYGVHPYVLLNYEPTLDSLFTIAHELGHSMHTFYSDKNQAFLNSEYPLFLAEIASTTNEAILLSSLKEKFTPPRPAHGPLQLPTRADPRHGLPADALCGV